MPMTYFVSIASRPIVVNIVVYKALNAVFVQLYKSYSGKEEWECKFILIVLKDLH